MPQLLFIFLSFPRALGLPPLGRHCLGHLWTMHISAQVLRCSRRGEYLLSEKLCTLGKAGEEQRPSTWETQPTLCLKGAGQNLEEPWSRLPLLPQGLLGDSFWGLWPSGQGLSQGWVGS